MALLKQGPSRGFRASRCPCCNLLLPLCICAHLRLEPASIHVVLLRHPNEALRASGTGFLALRCLGAELLQVDQVEARLAQGFAPPAALLFPPDGEECFKEIALGNPAPSVDMAAFMAVQTLIVPDGSWSEARRMVRRDPLLRTLPRVTLAPCEPWLDQPLRSDKWGRPCTAEAVGQLLAQRGDALAGENLKRCLREFVNAHWMARGRIPSDPPGS